MNAEHKKERAKWREKIFKYPKTKAEIGVHDRRSQRERYQYAGGERDV